MSALTVLIDITEGWTADIVAQLTINDAVFDGTGMTVTSVVKDREGKVIAVTTAWDVVASSQAKLSPDATHFIAANQPYSVHFKVVDVAGKIAYFPQGQPSQIRVYAT